MRIGVVTTSFPRWRGDSAGSFVEGHVRALSRLGHDVEVVAAGDGDEARLLVELRESARRESERRAQILAVHEVDLREGERRMGDRRAPEIRVIDQGTPHPVFLHRRVVARGLFYDGGAPDALERDPRRALVAVATFVPRFAARIAWHARRWDHIFAHWLDPWAIVARLTRKPLTATAHGGDIYTLRRLGMLRPALAALGNAQLVFVSEELRALAGGKGIVQPMGIDIAHFRALGRAPVSPPMILVAARLVPIKGVDTAIEALAHLPGMQLVIAGDGPERRALEARARNARVTFLGQVDTNRRDQLLREASIVAVPSRVLANGRREGCPTIALEALAAGVPVVATTGRANEIVAPDDPALLAQAIRRVMSAPQKTYELVEDLDWIRVAERLLRSE